MERRYLPSYFGHEAPPVPPVPPLLERPPPPNPETDPAYETWTEGVHAKTKKKEELRKAEVEQRARGSPARAPPYYPPVPAPQMMRGAVAHVWGVANYFPRTRRAPEPQPSGDSQEGMQPGPSDRTSSRNTRPSSVSENAPEEEKKVRWRSPVAVAQDAGQGLAPGAAAAAAAAAGVAAARGAARGAVRKRKRDDSAAPAPTQEAASPSMPARARSRPQQRQVTFKGLSQQEQDSVSSTGRKEGKAAPRDKGGRSG